MNNLEVILQSIINEGKTESNQILAEANARRDEILNEARKNAEAESKKIIDDANREAQQIIDNEAVSVQRASRDIEITAKNQVIDRVVDGLLDKLKSLDSDSYKQYVENTLKNNNINQGEILLSDAHKDAFNQSDFPGLSLSNETVEDGFVVRSGRIEYDNRFSSIIKYNIDNIRKEISDEIFK